MAEQGKKLMATLAVVVGSLHSLPTILPAVSALAKKHVELRREAATTTPPVGAALLWTLEQGLGAILDAGRSPPPGPTLTTRCPNFMIGEAYGRAAAAISYSSHVRRLLTRAEALSRRLHLRPADRARRRAALAGGKPRRAEPTGPDADHICRRRTGPSRAGGKLTEQEKFKREQHPFDAYDAPEGAGGQQRIPEARRQFPLALLRPVLRRAGAELLHVPAAHAERHPQALAVRRASPISPSATAAAMRTSPPAPTCRSARSSRRTRSTWSKAIQDLGLCSRGSGADNIRNVTGTPTAGIDPQELIDTRPYAREWHFHILNERALYGLPRKFNVAFDGAGIIPVLEDTNDIGFQAVEVKDGFGVEPGVWFRLALGGITGHTDFARDTGVIVKPADATKVADAIVRVFIEHGDRTNRNKARLKYVLDAMGFEKFLAAGRGEARLQARPRAGRGASRRGRRSTAPPISACMRRSRRACNWIGVVLPVGKLTAAQMRGLAGDRAAIWATAISGSRSGRTC